MTDVFGNYVLQKFIEFGSGAELAAIAQLVTANAVALSLHM
jgi:hypothetical protein